MLRRDWRGGKPVPALQHHTPEKSNQTERVWNFPVQQALGPQELPKKRPLTQAQWPGISDINLSGTCQVP